MRASWSRVAGCIGCVVAVVFASCTSLPLSANADQSLVVFPLRASTVTRAQGGVTLAVTLVLVRESDRREIPVHINLRMPYAAVALDPGAYLCSRIEVRRGWRNQSGSIGNNWLDTLPLSQDLAFYVVPRIVRLQERSLLYSDNTIGDGYSCFFPREGAQPADQKARLLAELKTDTHWAGWEGYQLVNFATE